MTFTDEEKAKCLMLIQYCQLYRMGFTNHADDIVELTEEVQEMLMEKGLV